MGVGLGLGFVDALVPEHVGGVAVQHEGVGGGGALFGRVLLLLLLLLRWVGLWCWAVGVRSPIGFLG